ncbi:hypothetical protein M0811_08352 [Anaeramoeba ignava]|uniref:Uncharacterized protein n=1 Tax=Anaeramoeba ignava TaxID=1746090 RepID=A0A9Q0LJ69_ANAIG|nr:hypothetical protein M0811_08352 [Anaeramoeba ignava]|eukprot:Anaeramoba_ignava/a219419_145.p1 GENE.a219419_145~~a219419_145.p1  ORF type:complete len:130 (-),score=35.32 a219419_145:52-405(-)
MFSPVKIKTKTTATETIEENGEKYYKEQEEFIGNIIFSEKVPRIVSPQPWKFSEATNWGVSQKKAFVNQLETNFPFDSPPDRSVNPIAMDMRFIKEQNTVNNDSLRFNLYQKSQMMK